jgi:hypothetical protein
LAADRVVLLSGGVCVAVVGEVTVVEAADLLDRQLVLTSRSRLDDEVRRRTDDVVAGPSPGNSTEATN